MRTIARFINSMLLMFFFSVPVIVHAQACQWAFGYGGKYSDQAYSVSVDNKNNVYIAGTFSDTVDFDPGPGKYNLISSGHYDIYILKLNAQGEFIWAKKMGGVAEDRCSDIVVDKNGNSYITGYYEGVADFNPDSEKLYLPYYKLHDIFIAKLDSDGHLLWADGIGGDGQETGSSIALDSSGNVYVTGDYSDTIDFDPGTKNYYMYNTQGSNTFILKLNSGGNFVWVKGFQDNLGLNFGNAIETDLKGNTYVLGQFQRRIDFDPGPDTLYLTANGNIDIFLCMLDPQGKLQWVKQFGGNGPDVGHSLALDTQGDIYFTGGFSDTVDFDPSSGEFNLSAKKYYDVFVSKLDPNGNFIWAKSIGDTTWDDIGYSIALDLEQNVYISGVIYGKVDLNPGAGTFYSYPYTINSLAAFFLVKLDAVGNFKWAFASNGTTGQEPYTVTTDNSGNIYTVGSYRDSITLYSKLNTAFFSNGNIDCFVAKYSTQTNSIRYQTSSNILPFPNPTYKTLHIPLKQIYHSTEIIISNAYGEIVGQKQYYYKSYIVIDLPQLTGCYHLKIIADGEIFNINAVKL